MTLNINIHNFNGPFDLLLHLIKKDKKDIYEISIYEITNQYLDYLKNMEELDLEVTSEFIVMAATLIEIKSKCLLPKVESCENQEENPTQELVDKLIEYKKFKAVAEFLKGKQKHSGYSFSREPHILKDEKEEKTFSMEELFKNISMLELFSIYNDLLNNFKNKINTDSDLKPEIDVEKFKVEDKMLYITSKFKKVDKVLFSDFMREATCKVEVVVIFLALLELIKLKIVNVYQMNNFNEIYVERIKKNEK